MLPCGTERVRYVTQAVEEVVPGITQFYKICGYCKSRLTLFRGSPVHATLEEEKACRYTKSLTFGARP